MYNQSTHFFSLLFALGLFTASSGYAQQDLANHPAPAQDTAMVDDSNQGFSIYPASIDSRGNLLLNAERAGWAVVEIKDLNGRTLLSQGMAVDKGFNKIPILFIPLLKQGTHTVVLRVDESIYSSQLVRK
ncbi:MAG: hypothetical protein JNL51_13985 [Chitinophagaceae bacterium]|nr:hypothetical protein [Chitinophagaceae bacterium]